MGRIYRQRSAENIISEIAQVIADYGISNFYFIDDLFTIDEQRLRELTRAPHRRTSWTFAGSAWRAWTG